MKKKKQKIGENLSSGAEKVEKIAKGETPQNTVTWEGINSTAINTPASQNTAAYQNIGGEEHPLEDETDWMKLTAAQKEARAA